MAKVIKVCPICGKEFEVYYKERNKRKHCSKECALKARVSYKKIKVKCKVCGKEKEVFLSKFKSQKEFYCSRQCYLSVRQITKECIYCGKVFTVPKYLNRIFCSKECQLKSQKKENEIIIQKDYAIIKIKNNKYGEFDCLIDIEDIDKIKDYYWNIRVDERKNNSMYIECRKNKKRIHIHRLIMNCPDDKIIDHINHNSLDNRKCNLRITNQKINCLNKTCKRYSYDKRGKFYAVYYNYKTIARFRNEENAKQYANYINELVMNNEWEKLNNLKLIKLSEK